MESPTRNSGEFHAAGVKRVEKLPSTYFLSIADRFEDLYLKAEAIPTVAFLGKWKISLDILRFLNLAFCLGLALHTIGYVDD